MLSKTTSKENRSPAQQCYQLVPDAASVSGNAHERHRNTTDPSIPGMRQFLNVSGNLQRGAAAAATADAAASQDEKETNDVMYIRVSAAHCFSFSNRNCVT
jgi:hypothetical protein